MDLKVGDKVRLKKGLIVNKWYSGLPLLDTMTKLNTDTIEYISNEGYIDMVDNNYSYSPEMLELVERAITQEEMYLNMQYYHSYCIVNGYVTPRDDRIC